MSKYLCRFDVKIDIKILMLIWRRNYEGDFNVKISTSIRRWNFNVKFHNKEKETFYRDNTEILKKKTSKVTPLLSHPVDGIYIH